MDEASVWRPLPLLQERDLPVCPRKDKPSENAWVPDDAFEGTSSKTASETRDKPETFFLSLSENVLVYFYINMSCKFI